MMMILYIVVLFYVLSGFILKPYTTERIQRMVIKRILVPFDISEYSLDASKEAVELAESFGASITFIIL
jgi:hypothetical protein